MPLKLLIFYLRFYGFWPRFTLRKFQAARIENKKEKRIIQQQLKVSSKRITIIRGLFWVYFYVFLRVAMKLFKDYDLNSTDFSTFSRPIITLLAFTTSVGIVMLFYFVVYSYYGLLKVFKVIN